MIDILTEIQEKYVPADVAASENGDPVHSVLSQLFFGGDQLTEERARNAQKGRSDGDNMYERLEGLLPKVEDWHAGRIIYQVHTLH